MNVQLVGGPDDGTTVEVPLPLAEILTIIVVRSDEDREYLEAVNTLLGHIPEDVPAEYLRDRYLLAARANTEPIYLFLSEVPHGIER